MRFLKARFSSVEKKNGGNCFLGLTEWENSKAKVFIFSGNTPSHFRFYIINYFNSNGLN